MPTCPEQRRTGGEPCSGLLGTSPLRVNVLQQSLKGLATGDTSMASLGASLGADLPEGVDQMGSPEQPEQVDGAEETLGEETSETTEEDWPTKEWVQELVEQELNVQALMLQERMEKTINDRLNHLETWATWIHEVQEQTQ